MVTSRPGPVLGAAEELTARVLPGRIENVPEIRRWVGALAGAAGCAPDSPELAVTELFTNAVRHSRSGAAGGMVTVIVATGPGGAVVHVHDQGANGDLVPHVRDQREADLAESGRGMRIIAALSVHWAAGPVAWCPQAAPLDPAVAAGGCCVRCHILPDATGGAPCAPSHAATRTIPRPR